MMRVGHSGSRTARRLVLALALMLPAAAAGASEIGQRSLRPLIGPRAEGLASLYVDRPATIADYVTALTRFRAGVQQGLFREASPLVPAADPPTFVPYLWTTDDGSAIRKLSDGSFVVARSSLFRNWHTETRCFGADWPNFSCGDDAQHTMAAPDLTTIIFDGIEYTRFMPAVGDAPLGDEPLPEDMEFEDQESGEQ